VAGRGARAQPLAGRSPSNVRYRELDAEGVVTTHGRHGTVVASTPPLAGPPPELLDATRDFADQASSAGATLDDALTAVRVGFASGAHA
jgi:hypothetical protein